ncbi:MAG: hypothetical protein BWZ10_02226 [candidate division BRC1 bacterium ADurb.BinA364]|nr:MAG: hypothetical protein BWZ10_02226 [candidate division BRC1 bacterium ADurb.BinA364]
MDRYKGVRIGMVVHCENGYLAMGSYSAGEAYDNDGKMIKEFKGGGSHAENFLEAVRDRKPEALAAPILEGHLSSALCHTGNISYRLGAGKSPEEIAEAIQDEPEARETFDRFLAHLDANGVDLKATPATLGPWLKMDPATERFTGGPEQANALLRREYRPPFVAPEQV